MSHTFYRRIIAILMMFLESLCFYLLFEIVDVNDQMFNFSLGLYLIYMFLSGHYYIRDRLIFSEIKKVFKATLFYIITFSIIMPFTLATDKRRYIIFIAIIMFFVSLFIDRTLRIVLRTILKRKTLIIGTGEDALRYAKLYNNNRFAITEVNGFIDLNTNKNLDQKFDNVISGDRSRFSKLPIYNYDELNNVIINNKIEQISIVDSSINQQSFDMVMRDCINLTDHIKYMPQDNHMMNFSSDISESDGMLIISASRNKVSSINKIVKRCIDIFFGIIGTLIVIPLALFIKVSYLLNGDKESIFFTHKRVGKDGKDLYIYKFRSMVPNAQEVLKELLESNPEIKAEWERSAKLENDPRVTKVGKLLRKTSLDEFPQFINVLKGDMSLIGPRPVIEEELEWYGDKKDEFLLVRPGLTGYWASHGRSNVDYPERCDLELYYVNHQSFMLEMEIVIKTAIGVIFGEGAK